MLQNKIKDLPFSRVIMTRLKVVKIFRQARKRLNGSSQEGQADKNFPKN